MSEIRRNFNEALERSAQDGTEYRYGAIAKDLAAVPVTVRLQYLPLGVNQFTSVFDTNGCASRAPNNILETKMTYALRNGILHPAIVEWLYNNGYIKFD